MYDFFQTIEEWCPQFGGGEYNQEEVKNPIVAFTLKFLKC